MSQRANDGPSTRRHGFVQGIGTVPLGPALHPSSRKSSRREENEPVESRRFAHTSSLNRYRNDSQASSSDRPLQSNERSESITASRRRMSFAERRNSDAWTDRHANSGRSDSSDHGRQNHSRTRHRDRRRSSYNRSRGRSRSPRLTRDLNGNIFSRRGSLVRSRDEAPYPAHRDSSYEPPRYFDVERGPPNDCRCPVSSLCPHNPEIDCRPLIPKMKSWKANQGAAVEISIPAQLTLSVADAEVCEVLKVFESRHMKRLELQPRARTVTYDQVREWVTFVQDITFMITQEALNESRILIVLKELLSAEQQPFRFTNKMPPDVEEDLTILLRKWTIGDLENHPDRGLTKVHKGNERDSYRLNKAWEFYKSANYFGAGDLINGQRWRSRMQMIRDGAHGNSQAGIWGPSIIEGSQALVMGLHGQSNEWYADRDEGNHVRYIGTGLKKREPRGGSGESDVEDANEDDNENSGPTIHTRMLFTSIETQKPVRLFRSWKLPHINQYRPWEGYRYDGLYRVVSFELLEKERQIFAFWLERLGGQGPLRKTDMRTFEETPEDIERKRRRQESARTYRQLTNVSR